MKTKQRQGKWNKIIVIKSPLSSIDLCKNGILPIDALSYPSRLASSFLLMCFVPNRSGTDGSDRTLILWKIGLLYHLQSASVPAPEPPRVSQNLCRFRRLNHLSFSAWTLLYWHGVLWFLWFRRRNFLLSCAWTLTHCSGAWISFSCAWTVPLLDQLFNSSIWYEIPSIWSPFQTWNN